MTTSHQQRELSFKIVWMLLTNKVSDLYLQILVSTLLNETKNKKTKTWQQSAFLTTLLSVSLKYIWITSFEFSHIHTWSRADRLWKSTLLQKSANSVFIPHRTFKTTKKINDIDLYHFFSYWAAKTLKNHLSVSFCFSAAVITLWLFSSCKHFSKWLITYPNNTWPVSHWQIRS